MYEHAGASCLLSVLIVAVFAILLHEKEVAPPAPSSAGVGERVADARARPSIATTPPTGTRDVPTPEPTPRPTPSIVVANPNPTPAPREPEVANAPPAKNSQPVAARAIAASSKVRVVSDRPETAPRPRKSPRPSVVPHRPRSSFAEVAQGEGLVDVATRVYGTPEAVGVLWRANRDRIVRPEDPVAAGTWLRTP